MSERLQTWLTTIVVVIAGFVAAGMGLYSFISSTLAPPLHPDAAAIPSVQDTTPSPHWADAVRQGQQISRAVLVSQDLPGLSVAVGIDGALVWAEGFGWADIERHLPVAPKMRFRIGHASKALTSAAVGLLVEKRRLDLDTEIQTYVPDFPKKQWPITLRQLMGHMAGVRHYKSEAEYMSSAAHCERASQGLKVFADDPLLFEPETEYRYSTFGWVLVSAAVEAAAREPFFSFMRTAIFDPLGMTATTVDSASEPIPDMATFYESAWNENRRPATTVVDYSCFAGAGAFVSTPSDLVRFGLALERGTLLKPETVTMLQTAQPLASGATTDYGLGWMLDTVTLAGESTRLANHSSRTLVGTSVSLLTFPDRDLVVAVTSNLSYAGTRDMALRIADAFAKEAKQRAEK